MKPNHLLHKPLSFEPIVFFLVYLWAVSYGILTSVYTLLRFRMDTFFKVILALSHTTRPKRMSLHELFLPNSLCTLPCHLTSGLDTGDPVTKSRISLS